MFSPAMKHIQRCREANEKKLLAHEIENIDTAKPLHPGASGDYELACQQLEKHLSALSDIDTVADKIALKHKLFEQYQSYLDAYIESGHQYRNKVLVQLMIWAFDIDNIERGLELAILAVEQRQTMPEKFKRNLPTWAAETVVDWAEKQEKLEQCSSPYIDQVVELIESEVWDVDHIIVLSKLYRIAGLNAQRGEDYFAAKAYYQNAINVNPEKSGCKTNLTKVIAALEKQQKKGSNNIAAKSNDSSE